MLLTLLFLLLLLVGIFMSIPIKKDSFSKWSLSDLNDGWLTVGAVGLVLGTIGVVTSLVIICCTQIPKNLHYEKALYEREMLVYRLENQDENIVGNELLYREITDFNNDLRSEKKLADNLWVNWFINEKIATIDYIEVE